MHTFVSFEYLEVDLLGHKVKIFSTLHETVKLFPNLAGTILYIHQQCRTVLPALHPHQQLIFLVSILATLVVMKWYLLVVLICNSQMINDVNHLFTCIFSICILSFEKCLLKSFAILKNTVVELLFLSSYWVACILYTLQNHQSQ